ncbi:MAG: hypothetical protein GDA48_09450 [Hormoscilla sp. GM102CHS1]|nr:hypothetical protein [Hormoscilla sp. GM102CHS1]
MKVLMIAFAVIFTPPAIAQESRVAPPAIAQESRVAPSTMAPKPRIAAPFGLEWGMRRNAIASQGVSLTFVSKKKGLAVYMTDSLPKNLSGADFYGLLFDESDRLVKVAYVSETISSDFYGAEGKKWYFRLKEKITRRYGKPESYEWIGLELYTDPDEFYQCLDYHGCGNWASFWGSKDEGRILLEIFGSGKGRGYVRLEYESPLLYEHIDKYERQTDVLDSDAL